MRLQPSLMKQRPAHQWPLIPFVTLVKSSMNSSALRPRTNVFYPLKTHWKNMDAKLLIWSQISSKGWPSSNERCQGVYWMAAEEGFAGWKIKWSASKLYILECRLEQIVYTSMDWNGTTKCLHGSRLKVKLAMKLVFSNIRSAARFVPIFIQLF